MNGPIEQTIRKFNPGTFQSDEELIRQFVVRKCELDIVLEVLRGNIDSPSCEHVLLVAPRGRGKTTLLARVAAELRTDTELSGRLLPIRFMEESQEIFNLADFWLETLFYLARESTERDPDLSRELQDTHADLAGEWRGENLEERTRAAVLEAADRIGMKLVLMVENLQALCEYVDDDFGWKLRGALQSEPQIMLLASATSRFKGLDDAREPFFELFRILRLEPLDTDQCRCLWQMVTRDAVKSREIRPLQILTGGNPRLLIIIADFARHRSLRELMEDLVSLIDDHTEYFRAHLEGFAKTERRVYLAVIDLWQPSTTGEIAARARMDVRSVSALLGRLVERGAVVVEGSGRKRMYAASERLYSIYYKLRRERDEAVVVRNLIHFMALFYDDDELDGWFRALTLEAAQWPALRAGIMRAIAESPQIGRIFYGEAWSGIERISDQAATVDHEKAKQVLADIMIARDEGKFEKVIEIVGRFIAYHKSAPDRAQEPLMASILIAKAMAHSKLGEVEAEIAAYDKVVDHFGNDNTPELLFSVAMAMFIKGTAFEKSGEFEVAIASYDQVVDRFDGNDMPDLRLPVAMALFCKGAALGMLGDAEEAVAVCDEFLERFGDSDAPEIQIAIAKTLFNKGVARELLGEAEAAVSTYGSVIARFGTSHVPGIQVAVARALVNKGYRQGRLGNVETEIATYDEVVERFGDSFEPSVQEEVAGALYNKVVALGLLGETEAETAACDDVAERFGDSNAPTLRVHVARALVNKAKTQTETGRAEEALHTCDEIDRRLEPLTKNEKLLVEWRSSWVKAKALLVLRRNPVAMHAFRSLYTAFVPGSEVMMRDMLARVPELIVAGASERAIVEILAGDEEKASALAPLVLALRQRTGENIRAPAEVQEVAADIRGMIELEASRCDTVPFNAHPREGAPLQTLGSK